MKKAMLYSGHSEAGTPGDSAISYIWFAEVIQQILPGGGKEEQTGWTEL